MTDKEANKIFRMSMAYPYTVTCAYYTPEFDDYGNNVNPDANVKTCVFTQNDIQYRIKSNIYYKKIYIDNILVYEKDTTPKYIKKYRRRHKI